VYDCQGNKLEDGDAVIVALFAECLKPGVVQDVQPINGALKIYVKSTKTEDGAWIDPAGILKLEPQP
jgi:hypothetical protein